MLCALLLVVFGLLCVAYVCLALSDRPIAKRISTILDFFWLPSI
jgi:hypothetical protein